jgi:hypothetical protein
LSRSTWLGLGQLPLYESKTMKRLYIYISIILCHVIAKSLWNKLGKEYCTILVQYNWFRADELFSKCLVISFMETLVYGHEEKTFFFCFFLRYVEIFVSMNRSWLPFQKVLLLSPFQV